VDGTSESDLSFTQMGTGSESGAEGTGSERQVGKGFIILHAAAGLEIIQLSDPRLRNNGTVVKSWLGCLGQALPCSSAKLGRGACRGLTTRSGM